MQKSRLAAPELGAIDIGGMTRGAFIVRSALAAGAAYGVGAVGPAVQRALGQESGGDVEIVNFALTLEQLESEFYRRGLREVTELSPEATDLAGEIGANEDEHVKALRATIEDLGGAPGEPPQLDFGDSFADETSFLKTAVTLEDTGVSAYNGAAPMIQSRDVLAAAAAIVQVEGRHAALVRVLAGEEPTIGAFDEELDQGQTLAELGGFIRS